MWKLKNLLIEKEEDERLKKLELEKKKKEEFSKSKKDVKDKVGENLTLDLTFFD